MKIETLNLSKSHDPKSAAASFVAAMKPQSVLFVATSTHGIVSEPRCQSFSAAWADYAALPFDQRVSLVVSGVKL